MNHAAQVLLLALSMTFTIGCCGPMWRAGCCDSGCNTACGDGCGPCEGCGELYIDPWINEPADCCDPCDACGNHNGQSCGKCRPVFAGVKSLWGYRCEDQCGGGCDSGGCDSGCSGGDCGCSGGGVYGAALTHPGQAFESYADGDSGYELHEGETIVESSISGEPRIGSGTVHPQISNPPQMTRRNGPSHSRQIFQPRRLNESRPLAY